MEFWARTSELSETQHSSKVMCGKWWNFFWCVFNLYSSPFTLYVQICSTSASRAADMQINSGSEVACRQINTKKVLITEGTKRKEDPASDKDEINQRSESYWSSEPFPLWPCQGPRGWIGWCVTRHLTSGLEWREEEEKKKGEGGWERRRRENKTHYFHKRAACCSETFRFHWWYAP